MIQKPNINDMLLFIEQTHTCEKQKVTRNEIQEMMKNPKYPKPNPFVIGHFEALNYMLTLPNSPDFPAKDQNMINNQYRSEETLQWLKKLHELMTIPLAKASFTPEWEDHIQINKYECGKFRDSPLALAFYMAPEPNLITKILHIWINDVFKLHEEVKFLIDNPYGISKEKSHELVTTAYNTNLLFCTLHPFTYGSNRLGRLIENLLRLTWRLKWKDVPLGQDYDTYVKHMQIYYTTEIPKYIEKTKKL